MGSNEKAIKSPTTALPSNASVAPEYFISPKDGSIWGIQIADDGEHFIEIRGSDLNSLEYLPPQHISASGKPGGRTYRSATERCREEVTRRILQKQQQGYRPSDASSADAFVVAFDQPFPPYLRTPKPIEQIRASDLLALHARGHCRYSVKYDGIGLVLVHHTFGWRFYTLNGNDITDQFPLHVLQLNQYKFEVGSLLKGEAVMFTGKTPWAIDFGRMNGRFGPGTSTQATRDMIAAGMCPEPSIVIYDCLVDHYEVLGDVTYDDRYALLGSLPVGRFGSGLISRAEHVALTPDTWRDQQVGMGIEGFVLNDGTAVLGNKIFSFATGPARPKGCYKLKIVHEEDVVAYAARVVNGTPESVFVKQRIPLDYTEVAGLPPGAWFPCGRVSLHRNPALIEAVNNLISQGLIIGVPSNKDGEALAVDSEYGVTIVITFAERLKSRKFRFAVFAVPHRLRHDPESGDFKSPQECFAQTLCD